MHAEEPNAPAGRALSPEEVGARVSAILEAAERDARAVIDAAHRELAERETVEPERAERTLEVLAHEVDELAARVGALERALAAAGGPPAVASAPAPPAVRERRVPIDPAARVRAIELALAGYPREAIAQELAASMSPADIEGLLDEVLSR